MRFGITSEIVAIAGMVLGVLAGFAFTATGETPYPRIAWTVGGLLCLLRIVTIQLDGMLQPSAVKQSREDEFYNELPERVSDAVTLLGFGFAVASSPWLGLAAALAAIFSAYVRSLASARAGWKRATGPVLMNRTQRLVVLSSTAALMVAEVQERLSSVELPRLALTLVVAGCLITVALRWFTLRGIKV